MTKLDPYEKFYPEFSKPSSIQRMPLKDSAMVELVRVESPSSLFLRPIDHIRDQLIYREPYMMVPIRDFEPGNYALAPIEERAFGRCLIVKNIKLLEACRVFFIDDAITANVSWKCLFQLESQEKFHPWQVMHVSLGRIVSLTNEWSFEQRRCFSELLEEFSQFHITPCQVDVEDDQDELDRPSILVNLYGILENRTVEQKVSIEEICAVSMEDVMVSYFPMNLIADPQLVDLDKEQDDLEVILLEEFRRDLPYDWLHEPPPAYVEGDEDWDIVTCKLAEWEEKWLKKYLLEDGCFWGFITSNVTVSPWDMHITPIMKEDKYQENEEWIFDQFKYIKKMQLVFDDFYSDVKNQRPLEEEEIRVALSQGRAYAIAAVEHRKKTGPEWLRCEILDFLSNNNLALRFVDQGFRGFANIKNIYRVHRMHTAIPPFMIEMGRYFDDNSVSEREMEYTGWAWRDMVPYDVPVVVGPEMEFIETGKLQFRVIREIGEDENLLERLDRVSLDDIYSFMDTRASDLGSDSSDSEVNIRTANNSEHDNQGLPVPSPESEEEDYYDSLDNEY